jgi:outer membrane biosynthesis protein TonB
MNIVLIFFWCNPVFWIIRRELNMIHEFIADKKAVEDNDTGAFAAMILQATYPQQRFNITNNFFYSPLKRRLAMLTKNKNPKMNYLSRMLVLPLAALVFFAFTLKVKPLNNKGQYEGITIKGKNDTVPPAVDSSYVIITNKKRLSSFNDSIPKYYKGKKMKGAQGDKLNKTFIYYEDGSTDTISTTEAEKLRIIPPPPPPPPAVDRDDNKVFTKVEVDPSFPGGETAWQKYITKIMTANIDELAKENKSGTCRVRFIVDVDGSVRDVKVLSMQGTKLAEISENAIRKGPKWVPAKQNDRVVTAYREQPITFTISEN